MRRAVEEGDKGAAGHHAQLGLREGAVGGDGEELGRVAVHLGGKLGVVPDEVDVGLHEGEELVGSRPGVAADVVLEQPLLRRLDGEVRLEQRAADGDVAERRRLQLHAALDELVEPRGVDSVGEEVVHADELECHGDVRVNLADHAHALEREGEVALRLASRASVREDVTELGVGEGVDLGVGRLD